MTSQQKIDEIMDNFDFARVESAMKSLGWTWLTGEDSHYPDQRQLRKAARELLNDAVNMPLDATGSGGFHVENAGGVLSLSFCVDRWDVCDYEQEATQ